MLYYRQGEFVLELYSLLLQSYNEFIILKLPIILARIPGGWYKFDSQFKDIIKWLIIMFYCKANGAQIKFIRMRADV